MEQPLKELSQVQNDLYERRKVKNDDTPEVLYERRKNDDDDDEVKRKEEKEDEVTVAYETLEHELTVAYDTVENELVDAVSKCMRLKATIIRSCQMLKTMKEKKQELKIQYALYEKRRKEEARKRLKLKAAVIKREAEHLIEGIPLKDFIPPGLKANISQISLTKDYVVVGCNLEIQPDDITDKLNRTQITWYGKQIEKNETYRTVTDFTPVNLQPMNEQFCNMASNSAGEYNISYKRVTMAAYYKHQDISYHDLQEVPTDLIEKTAKYVEELDLSYNRISYPFIFLIDYTKLSSLVIDHNVITSHVKIPDMPTLHTLWVNHNRIENLSVFVGTLAKHCPNLRFLSMMSNKAAPSYFNKGSLQQYIDYRYFVISRLPKLEVLDDKKIEPTERSEAERIYKSVKKKSKKTENQQKIE
ncbi:hypothetical protein ACF0H5_005610 [Mactra antiquata]